MKFPLSASRAELAVTSVLTGVRRNANGASNLHLWWPVIVSPRLLAFCISLFENCRSFPWLINWLGCLLASGAMSSHTDPLSHIQLALHFSPRDHFFYCTETLWLHEMLSWSTFALFPLLEFRAFHWSYFLSIHSHNGPSGYITSFNHSTPSWLTLQSQVQIIWTLVYHLPVSQKSFLLLRLFLVLALSLAMLQFFLVCAEVDTLCSVCGRRHSVGVGVCVHMCTDGEARGLCQVSSLTASETRSLTELSAHWLARMAGPQLQRFACLYPSPRTGVVDAHWPHLASLCGCWDLDSGNSLYDTPLTEPSPSLLIYFLSIIICKQPHLSIYLFIIFLRKAPSAVKG